MLRSKRLDDAGVEKLKPGSKRSHPRPILNFAATISA